MPGIHKGLSGDSQRTNTKIDEFIVNTYFASNSPYITYTFMLFTVETNIHKFHHGGTQRWGVLVTLAGRRPNNLTDLAT